MLRSIQPNIHKSWAEKKFYRSTDRTNRLMPSLPVHNIAIRRGLHQPNHSIVTSYLQPSGANVCGCKQTCLVVVVIAEQTKNSNLMVENFNHTKSFLRVGPIRQSLHCLATQRSPTPPSRPQVGSRRSQWLMYHVNYSKNRASSLRLKPQTLRKWADSWMGFRLFKSLGSRPMGPKKLYRKLICLSN